MTNQEYADQAITTALAQTKIKVLAPSFRLVLKTAITLAIQAAIQQDRSRSAGHSVPRLAERGIRRHFPWLAHVMQGLSFSVQVKR